MSGTAPTPRLFGRDEAETRTNPRTPEQMAPQEGPRLFGGGADWWEQRPVRTTLATTTGQNLEGTENAFDTNFWNARNIQEQEQKTLQGRWDRPDATGIVTYDSEREGNRFGDVYQNGRKVGNMYEGYAGMTTRDADEIMARLILPRETWAKAYETEAGRPLTFAGDLSDEIQNARTVRSDQFEKGLSAAEFEASVNERAAGMEGSGAWQAGNVAAGVAGGTVTGLGIAGAVTALSGGVGAVAAPFIIGGFALAGGLGSYLNRDEGFRAYSTALEQWEMATGDGHTDIGLADAATGFAGAAADKLNVTRNLLHGVYDGVVGTQGDQSSAYQDTETPLLMQGADLAALVVDGVGSFGSAAARRTFTALMGTTTAASATSVALGAANGNLAFNPYTGDYEDIGVSGTLQRAGSVGIDAAQTAAAGVLGRVLRGGRAAAAASEGGWVVKTVDGTRQASRVGFSALIPSEAAVGISARTIARRTMLNQGIANTAENRAIQTARALEDLTSGRKGIAVAAVNGFGEGAEEFVQAVLGATAYGETPTFRELLEATKQGFAMGAGMGGAIAAGSYSRSQQYLQRANLMRAVRGEEEFTAEEWKGLTESDQLRLGTPDTAEDAEFVRRVTETLVAQGGKVAAANFPEMRRAVETARAITEQQQKNATGIIDPSRLQVRSNHEWAPQDYVISLDAAIKDIASRQELLAQVAQGGAGQTLSLTEDERKQAGLIASADNALVTLLRQVQAEIASSGGNADYVRAVLDQVNAELRNWWHARDDNEEITFGKRRSVSVWGARYPLNAAGSFQLMRLQISPELTLAGNNNTVMVPDEILAPTGGDFDGDRFINQLRLLLPEESYQMQRWGSGQLTSQGTMLNEKPYVKAALELMADTMQQPGSPDYKAGTDTLARIRTRIGGLLARSSMPADARMQVVGLLTSGFRARNPKAMSQMFTTLATRYAPAMRELAQDMDDSPWLAINRIIEDELRDFQTTVATTDAKPSRTGQVLLPATRKNLPRRRPNRVSQTSDMLQGLTVANKFDVFRLQTVLKYNARREATTTSPEEWSDQLADLFRTFTARNDKMVRPGEQAIFDGTLAQERTISWLQSIAEQYRGEFGLTVNEAMVMLAGADVQDTDLVNRRPRSAGTVRLIQTLLHEVVTGLRSEYAEVLGRDEAVAQRFASLDALTRPTFQDGAHTHAQGGDAFVEVLGAFPIGELLHSQGNALKTWTVRGLRDHLISLRGTTRQEFEAALRQHPDYGTEDGEVLPYRVLVDNVIESARMQLSENLETGQPQGALTRSSVQASANFKAFKTSTRKLLHSRGVNTKDPAAIRAALAQDLRLAEATLALVEERGVVAGTVLRTQDGELSEVQFSQWIYDVLAEPETAVAEMMLLRQTLVNGKAALQTLDEEGNPTSQLDPHRVSDRILRLWLDLDVRANDKANPRLVQDIAARDKFLEVLTESQTVEHFIARLNLSHEFRDDYTPPYIAWARDLSLVADSRFGKGVSEVQQGTGMREALRDAAKVAAAVHHDDEALAAYSATNAELLAQLRAARDAGPGTTGRAMWDRFVSWFELSKDLPTMVGVSVWINQAAHINEIVGNMGVKGIAPDNVAPLGRAAAAQLPTFDSGVGQLLASMTSSSVGSLLTDPTQLARGPRTIVLNDGTVVDWEGITPEQALDLLMDEETAGMASRMLGMTAWDYNEDLNQNILVSIVGTGVADFTARPEVALFGRDQQSKFRRLMTLEAMAKANNPGGPPIIPMLLATQMNIREAALEAPISDRTGQREDMAVQILEDIADALDAVSRIDGLFVSDAQGLTPNLTPQVDELTGEPSTVLHQALLNAARRVRQDSGMVSWVSRFLSHDSDLRDQQQRVLIDWQQQYLKRALASGDPLMLKMAETLAKDITRIDEVTSPLDVLLDTYGEYDDPAVQRLLVGYVQAAGDIVNVTSWAREELLRVMDTANPLPSTDARWEIVARAVIAHTMHTSYGIATRSDTQIAVFPSLSKKSELDAQRAFWDPSFAEPLLDIFAPGLLDNPAAPLSPLLVQQLELVRSMGRQLPTTTAEKASELVYRLASPRRTTEQGYDVGVTGQWHALLPALMHSAQGAVMASPAESGIQMAGLGPDRYSWLSATTRQDWSRRPGDDELSTTTIPASEFVAGTRRGEELNTEAPMQIAGYQGVQFRPLAQLQGRVVRKLDISVAGQTFSLLGDQRYGSGLLLPAQTGVLAGEAGVLDLRTLRQSVLSWMRDNDIPRERMSEVTLEFSFFHPDSKAVSPMREGQDYEHSPWFDGVDGRTDAAFSQNSLAGSFFFGLDGVVPAAYERALAAIKKLTFALQQVTTLPEQQRRAMIGRGLTDMGGMLDQLTDFVMKQKIDGQSLDLVNYNAVRKILSLLYVVRYFDESGPHVVSSETAIARQMRGEAFPDNAEVVGLPLQHVLALMGEQSSRDFYQAPRGDLLYSPDISRAQQYLRFPAEAWTDQMFGGLLSVQTDEAGTPTGWSTADLLSQPAFRHQPLPRARVRAHRGQTAHSSRDFFGPFRKHAEQVFGSRGGQNPGKWAEQRARVRGYVTLPDSSIAARTMQAVQHVAEGRPGEGAALLARQPIDVAPTNDLTTGWVYTHFGEQRGSVVNGVLRSVQEIGANAALGDDVYVPASTFIQAHGLTDMQEAFATAAKVLDEIMRTGATIHLPPDTTAGVLRTQLGAYLREHDYAEQEHGSGVYLPQPSGARPQQTAAFHATLSGADVRSSENRVLVEFSPLTPQNENSIFSMNGGIGALETYDMREVVQTSRYAGYGLPLSNENDARIHLINTLLPVVRSAAGKAYLAQQSEIADTDREAAADLGRALEHLEARLLEARSNPTKSLVPADGETFGTGDIIPLVSYNDRDELVGIHLYRHGHLPVSEQVLRGADLPAGNLALGVDGVRLTVDLAKVDPMHTTHRGEVVSSSWLGMQGFLMRLRTQLSDLGSKIFEVGTAMKWTTTPPPADLYVPKHPIFAGRPVLGAADIASPHAKTADGAWLNTPSRIIEAVGYDVMPHLVELFTGVKFQQGTEAEYAEARNRVVAALERFRAIHGGSADAAALVTRRTSAFDGIVREQLEARINELLDTEINLDGGLVGDQLANATLATLVLSSLSAGAQVDEVIGAPGYIRQPAGSKSHTMHPVFTTLLHQLPHNHPARQAFVRQINSRMPWQGNDGYELTEHFTWIRHVELPDGRQQAAPVMLGFPVMRATDTNDALAEQGAGRKQRGSISSTTLAMAYQTHGAVPLLTQQLNRGNEVFEPNRYFHGGITGARKLMFGATVSSSPRVARMDDDLRLNRAEAQHVYGTALPRRKALAVPIDQSGWYVDQNKAMARASKQAYDLAFNNALHHLKLGKGDSLYLTEMLRAVLARPATEGQGEFMTYREALAGLKLITKNAKSGIYPTHGGAVNVVSRAALLRLHTRGYPLLANDGSKRPLTEWDDFVNVVLSEAFSDDPQLRGYPAVSNMVDGLLYEYRKDTKGLPATTNPKLANIYRIARSRSGLFVASPEMRRRFDNPSAQDGEYIYDPAEFETMPQEYDDLPQDARAIVERRMAAWESGRGLSRQRRAPLREAVRGQQVREDLARTNVLLRFAQLGLVLKTLVNPGLYASAFIELANKGAQERMVSFLAGENVRAQGFTPEQRQLWKDTLNRMTEQGSPFYAMVYAHTNYRVEGDPETRVEAKLQRWTNFLTAMFNDPMWGTRSKPLASAFLEAAWDSVNRFSGRAVTIEQFLDTVAVHPEQLGEISQAALQHGIARIEYRRNLQDNLLERTRRTMVEGIINSGLPGANFGGTLLLRFPTLFFRFRSNTIINLTGMQGPHAVLASLMSGRSRKPGGLIDTLRTKAGMTPDDAASEQARIEDSFDLTRAIIRSGVSHTQLFTLGMMLSAMGFGGEDDEEKVLNKLRRYQQPLRTNDPLSLESDFRNAEAWFNDMLPAGMGVPSWIIRPFVSPAMGVARFHETGDFRQVLWGFMDALGNLPLLNVDTVLNAWGTANELAAAAEAHSLEQTDEATEKATKFMVTAVGTLEAMLFESSFASLIYQAADEWDRDPYAMPLRDSDGDIQRYGNGLPRPTDMLDEYLDENGEVRQGYTSRNDFDATLRALAENRPVLAYALSAIMSDSTFIRYNMVPKTREIDAQELTEDEAREIVVSVFNNELGGEVLTHEGAEGVIRGIHLGTVALDSPALQGIFIPEEMRFDLQKQFLAELTDKYLSLDYSKTEALSKARAEYYGQEYGAPEGLGLADILWDKQAIPEYQTQTYLQLNTTYVMGPNGRPIATGLKRSVLDSVGLNLEGLGLFQTFHNDGPNNASNMPTDQLLNSQDLGRGMNLGQRGLVKVDDSWIPPTDEEIGESITEALDEIAEAIEDMSDRLDGSFGNGWRNFGRGGYGGGGGGGYRANYGGQAVRLNTPRGFNEPYALDPRVVNPGNPIIRRATVRRERFSSDRGRLNQWQ